MTDLLPAVSYRVSPDSKSKQNLTPVPPHVQSNLLAVYPFSVVCILTLTPSPRGCNLPCVCLPSDPSGNFATYVCSVRHALVSSLHCSQATSRHRSPSFATVRHCSPPPAKLSLPCHPYLPPSRHSQNVCCSLTTIHNTYHNNALHTHIQRATSLSNKLTSFVYGAQHATHRCVIVITTTKFEVRSSNEQTNENE